MRTLYSQSEIAARVAALGREVVTDLGSDFTLVPILTGGFIFGADLARAVSEAGGDPVLDTLHLASYGDRRTSSGIVKLLKDLTKPVEGRTVLLVDDVLDSGRSLYFASQLMEERGAARIARCVAVDKKTGRAVDVEAEHAAFTAGPDDFLVGYGMDDGGHKRALPFIGAL